MRFSIAILPAGLFLTPPLSAQEATPDASLLARIDQFNDAIREGDREKYADVFVEDFVFTWAPDGQIYDLESILPNVVPTPDHDPIVDEVIVRARGDAAIVNCRFRTSPSDTGVRVTLSFARVGGVWKVLAYQSTRIVEGGG